MKTARDIIIKPIVTEHTMNLFKYDNKYTFKVLKTANKREIKGAIEEIFKVNVLKVTTMNVCGKTCRRGKYVGKTSDWKKAIVKVQPDQKIEFMGAPLFEV